MVNAEMLDQDRRGWGPRRALRLVCPVPQSLLDLVVAHGLLVRFVVRDQSVTDIRRQVSNNEVSLAAIEVDAVRLLDGAGSRLLVWA
mgnify:CR=1 FL=1